LKEDQLTLSIPMQTIVSLASPQLGELLKSKDEIFIYSFV